jgi:hypothetical protein
MVREPYSMEMRTVVEKCTPHARGAAFGDSTLPLRPAQPEWPGAGSRQYKARLAFGACAPPLLNPVLLLPSLWIDAPPAIRKPNVLL